jgi:hypothetical protein
MRASTVRAWLSCCLIAACSSTGDNVAGRTASSGGRAGVRGMAAQVVGDDTRASGGEAGAAGPNIGGSFVVPVGSLIAGNAGATGAVIAAGGEPSSAGGRGGGDAAALTASTEETGGNAIAGATGSGGGASGSAGGGGDIIGVGMSAGVNAGGATSAASGNGGSAPAAASTAVYVVPAGPDTPETRYTLATPKSESVAGTYRLDYQMPALLVGNNQRISLRGTLDATGRIATVSGPAGSATCDLMPGGGLSVRCTEMLPGVVVDLAAVERLARASDPTTVTAFVAIAARFSSEPIGVVEIR